MDTVDGQSSGPELKPVVRTFWHGPFSPYEALCLLTFVTAGIRVELFADHPIPELPDGVVLRDAREIIDDDVSFYQHEFDGPSPSLHSNHFRYALLEKVGGWWVDADVMFVGTALPVTDSFAAHQTEDEINTAVLRFPAGDPLMGACRERTEARRADARWGEVGPKLLTELQPQFAPHLRPTARDVAYAIGPEEFEKVLLPDACEEIERRTSASTFVHLWNEMWRRAGIPKTIAPPRGSWLDRMFERHQFRPVWSNRLEPDHIQRWAALRRDRDHAGHWNHVHYQELTRLRAERGARRGMLSRLMARLKSERDK
ncbi:hypothetical protein JQ596_20830 [Bradyrhizobium manausense]|uniref:hypothetical protein n=1 Tax=Bradyrhizobium TaxID=374 RepID=UPI001BA4673A|nr:MULTISPECIES: hypothetical protein [Bradyrhizobium]MBR0827982.1 hypothetical protein [Bradyrhizobium manausense]UVO32848.1 hypothetical protein KUF59_20630 [Bradyrhizobium arachidis]